MFESGIQKYAVFTAEIETGFPVDNNGVAYIYCKYCRYFTAINSKCKITEETVAFPDKYVGFRCPFKDRSEKECSET